MTPPASPAHTAPYTPELPRTIGDPQRIDENWHVNVYSHRSNHLCATFVAPRRHEAVLLAMEFAASPDVLERLRESDRLLSCVLLDRPDYQAEAIKRHRALNAAALKLAQP